MNPGVLTAFVVFPEPYSASTITNAVCDGAPLYDQGFSEDEGKAILKFLRAQMTEVPLDTYFIVRGTFLWNEVEVPFQGSDSIMKVLDEGGSQRSIGDSVFSAEYVLGKKQPQIEEGAFSVSDPDADFLLYIENGEDGENGVNSVILRINGNVPVSSSI